jgi:hypothetical protein
MLEELWEHFSAKILCVWDCKKVFDLAEVKAVSRPAIRTVKRSSVYRPVYQGVRGGVVDHASVKDMDI